VEDGRDVIMLYIFLLLGLRESLHLVGVAVGREIPRVRGRLAGRWGESRGPDDRWGLLESGLSLRAGG
jgi:hypothetical protein